MLRLIADEELSMANQTSVFQILINVAQDQSYIEECVELNVARRLFDWLMKNVKQDVSANTGSSA